MYFPEKPRAYKMQAGSLRIKTGGPYVILYDVSIYAIILNSINS